MDRTSDIDIKGLWKENWDETRTHFLDWWSHRGLIITCYGNADLRETRAECRHPAPPAKVDDRYTDPAWVASHRRHALSQRRFIADNLPSMHGETYMHLLSHILGAIPKFDETTIWNEPCIHDPETHPPLRFDPESKWWKSYFEVMRAEIAASNGNYYVGIPLFMNDLDVLFDMRGNALLIDMIDAPDWVDRTLADINDAYKEAYGRLYEMAKLPDGSSIDEVLDIWGPGKTALLQSDVSVMLSPEMFSSLVAPHISALANWLDHAMFHLDGPNMLCHLDTILKMEGIDAIQWMAGAGQPGHGDPKWYPLYRKILKAGKSVQILSITLDEVEPLLGAIGGAGVYISVVGVNSTDEFERIMRIARKYRAPLRT